MDHAAISALAASQHGVVSLAQACSLGASAQQVRRLQRSGAWRRIHTGVFVIGGAPATYEQQLVAACLAVGPETAASHRAAAVLHGLLQYREPPIEVTTTRLRSPERAGVTVHRLADLHERWVQEVRGVRTTSVARTLVDLGAVASFRTVEAALDRAAGRKLVVYREVRDAMVSVARQGRRGVGKIRPLLDDRIGEVIPESVLAARMRTVLRHAGLSKAAQPEYTVTDELGGFIAVADFAFPEVRLAIEVDGYEFHSSPAAIAYRNQRDRLLAEADWPTLHFLWEEVERHPQRIANELRRHYLARLRSLSERKRAEKPGVPG